ncbi:hypothetical protein QJQ45_002637 [Haematococcus lacustris]|nr:hypothetical protein QJQ45_002637 [Haematococcus lacustris]
MSRNMSLLALVCLVLAGLASAQDVPQECMSGAMSLQSACSSELSKASATLGVPVTGNDPASLGQAVQKATASGKSDQALAEFKPSSGCCKAACAFGAAGCLCKQSVVDMTNSVMKVDSGMAKQCKWLCGRHNVSKVVVAHVALYRLPHNSSIGHTLGRNLLA